MVLLLEGLVAFPPVEADVRVDSGMFQEGQEIARYLAEHRDEGRALTLPNTRWGWGPMFNSGVVYAGRT